MTKTGQPFATITIVATTNNAAAPQTQPGNSHDLGKLHRWAAADPDRRLDDLFNFAYDPATLIVAFDRVAG